MIDLSQRWALIIPAAGKGLRYGADDSPKQFLKLAGRSLLAHSVLTGLSVPNLTTVVVAVSEEALATTAELLKRECSVREDSSIDKRVVLIPGGQSRQESVKRSLSAIADGTVDYVFVHDSVRPLASIELYDRVGRAGVTYGAAVPCMPLVDTIKEVHDGIVVSTPQRDRYRRIQTPQGFRLDILADAHAYATTHGFTGTDDASLVEMMGIPVHCVDGEETNVKVTTPSDLRLLDWLLTSNS
ncbi:MAG: 2-C-methyl-D-erythritol 4-phosphate cytidylyltransferase [bacterium]|nr:2-C-methyl-D-erythritol 4-phosphate cytidylyltransferase [bacterium]